MLHYNVCSKMMEKGRNIWHPTCFFPSPSFYYIHCSEAWHLFQTHTFRTRQALSVFFDPENLLYKSRPKTRVVWELGILQNSFLRWNYMQSFEKTLSVRMGDCVISMRVSVAAIFTTNHFMGTVIKASKKIILCQLKVVWNATNFIGRLAETWNNE